MSYRYWVVRFVPDVGRGEFTNIGIVCGRDGGDWSTKFDLRGVRNRGGLSRDLRELQPWVEWFEHRARGESNLTELDPSSFDANWLSTLRDRQAGSIQLSEALPVDVRSAREGIQVLFPMLIQRVGTRQRSTLTRQTMRAEVIDALSYDLDLQTGRSLLNRPRFSIGLQKDHFDVGINVDADAQFANVWAFNIGALDVLERDIRAWNYMVGRLRSEGADLEYRRRTRSVPKDAPIEVIVDSPHLDRTGRRDEIFAAANEAWQLNDVQVRTYDDYLAGLESNVEVSGHVQSEA